MFLLSAQVGWNKLEKAIACPGTIQKCACQPREMPVSPIPAETGQPNTWMLPFRTNPPKKNEHSPSRCPMFIIDLLETGTTNQSPKIAKRLAVRLVQILLDAVFHLAFGDVVLQKSAAAFVQVGLHVSIVDHMAPMAAMAAMAAMAVPIQVPTKARIFSKGSISNKHPLQVELSENGHDISCIFMRH